ncbi:hypothetical protein [Paenibacillus sp. sgz302251]
MAKFSTEEKLQAVQAYLAGKESSPSYRTLPIMGSHDQPHLRKF